MTDGTQLWYQTVGNGITDTYPVFDTAAGTVYQHTETIYANTGHTPGESTYVFSEDDGFWYCKGTVPCTICGSALEEEDGCPNEDVTTDPTCTEEGVKTWTFTFENPAFTTQTKDVTLPALGHLYETAPAWTWTSPTSAIARFTCSRCTTQDYVATVTDEGGVTTASVTVYGTTYTDVLSNNNVLFVGENTVHVVAGESRSYTFTPVDDGYYRFWSSGSTVDASVTFDADHDFANIASTDDFNGVESLQGGTTYTLQFSSANVTGDMSVFIKKVTQQAININSGTYPGCGITANGATNVTAALEGTLVYLDVENVPASATSVSWDVVDSSNQPVTLYEESGSTYFIMPDADVAASCTISVPYIAADGTTQSCTAFTLITSYNGNVTYGAFNETSWYVVPGNVTINGELYLKGASHVILTDGSTLTVSSNNSDAIRTYSSQINAGLYIYGQALCSGRLNASSTSTSSSDHNALDIGGVLKIYGGNVSCDAIYTLILGHQDITINGGSVVAISQERNAVYSSSSSGNIIINGGYVTAIGKTFGLNANKVYLGWSALSDRIRCNYVSSYSFSGTVYVKEGQALTDGHDIFSGQLTSSDLSSLSGAYLLPCITMTDGSDNAATIQANDNTNIAVGIQGRTLYRDGYWNTLCLPFSKDTFTYTVLSSATVMSLSSSSFANGTLTLNFEPATTIEAGKPYIVKWTNPTYDIENPVFNYVTISDDPPHRQAL